jgi:multiple sugar transport system permease protein
VLFAIVLKVGILVVAQAWLGLRGTAMAALIVTRTWAAFPWMMVMILAGLQTVPPELY